MQCLIAFCSRLETASDVVSGSFLGPIVHDKLVKFCDSRFKHCREILPEAFGSGIFYRFENFDNCQPEVASDAISSKTIQYVGVDACAKCGDSRLNGSRNIRLPHFDVRTT